MKKVLYYSASDYIHSYGLPFRIMLYPQKNNLPHHHDFQELVIVLNGSAVHRTAEKHYPISRGDVFLVRKDSIHCYQNTRELKLANVMFNFDDLASELLDLPEIPGFFALFKSEPATRAQSNFRAKHTLSPAQLSEVEMLLNRLEQECSRQKPGFRFAARNLLFELLIYLSRSYASDEKKYSRRMIKLSLMLKFIEENFHRDISREEIMAQAEVSISVGSRIFQEFLHETPVGYLIRVRINHATELLRRSDLPVSEIAFRCGFRDSNYFSLQFKKATAQSPREFRRH